MSESLMGEALHRLLRWLAPNQEQAGQQYELLRRKLIFFFIRYNCVCPEDLADKTLDRVAQRLAAGEVIRAVQPSVYCMGVARNVLFEYWRAPERKDQVSLETLSPWENLAAESLSAQRLQEESAATERQLNCLTECLQRLPPADQQLIKDYYYHDELQAHEKRKLLAQRLGLSPTGLRARVHRVRQRLERCFKTCVARG